MSQSFNILIEELRKAARELLEEGRVDMFIGFGPGTMTTRTTPLFIREPGGAEELTWSPFCAVNLTGYLLDYREGTEKIGILVKGCDSRSVIRLLQDSQFPRERLVIVGIPCTGILDGEKAAPELDPLAGVQEVIDQGDSFLVTTAGGEKSFAKEEYLLPRCLECLECLDAGPVVCDRFIGREPSRREGSREGRREAGGESGQEGSGESGRESGGESGQEAGREGGRMGGKRRFAEVEELEKLSPAERSRYWDRYFQSCLRCYACRNVCPACNCRECIFDETGTDWVSKRNNLSENTAYHIIRALHVAGRCVDCGECQRVCPVNIPLRALNQKVLKDIEELYDAPLPGTDLEQPPVLGHYCAGDPDEFK